METFPGPKTLKIKLLIWHIDDYRRPDLRYSSTAHVNSRVKPHILITHWPQLFNSWIAPFNMYIIYIYIYIYHYPADSTKYKIMYVIMMNGESSLSLSPSHYLVIVIIIRIIFMSIITTTTTTTTTCYLVILYLKCMDYIVKLRAQSSQRISNQLSISLWAMDVFLCLLVCSLFWWFSF